MLFNDVLDKINAYENNLMTQDELFKWFDDNVEVKCYIPVTTKYTYIRVIADLFKKEAEENRKGGLDEFFDFMEYDILFSCYAFTAYTGINIPPNKRMPTTYDKLASCGLFNRLSQKVGFDFNDFKSKCDAACNVDGYMMLHQAVEIIAERLSPENIQEVGKAISKLDMRKLKLLEQVTKYNSPAANQIVDSTMNVVREEVKKKMKEDKKVDATATQPVDIVAQAAKESAENAKGTTVRFPFSKGKKLSEDEIE